MLNITSPQNDLFKRLLSLTSSRGLKEEPLFLLSGEKLVREFLLKRELTVAYELIAPAYSAVVAAQSAPLEDNVILLTPELFRQIDSLGTHSNILVLEQPKVPTLSAGELETYRPRGIEVVIPVGDPGNLGALLRSCEAFGVGRVILTREAAHPFLPKSVKASAGSALRIPMVRGPALSEFPPSCIALDMFGTPLNEFVWPESGFLVVGEEGLGLSEGHFRTSLSIPTHNVESLNAVVAVSIALSHMDICRRKTEA